MAGWYEIRSNTKGQFSFVLKAGNAEPILTSEMYEKKDSAKNGIASVQKNCEADSRYERKLASDGKAYFTLRAANHEVIGTSQMYANEKNRDDGIASVKANGTSSVIKEV
jgi:uncharacterized protein